MRPALTDRTKRLRAVVLTPFPSVPVTNQYAGHPVGAFTRISIGLNRLPWCISDQPGYIVDDRQSTFGPAPAMSGLSGSERGKARPHRLRSDEPLTRCRPEYRHVVSVERPNGFSGIPISSLERGVESVDRGEYIFSDCHATILVPCAAHYTALPGVASSTLSKYVSHWERNTMGRLTPRNETSNLRSVGLLRVDWALAVA